MIKVSPTRLRERIIFFVLARMIIRVRYAVWLRGIQCIPRVLAFILLPRRSNSSSADLCAVHFRPVKYMLWTQSLERATKACFCVECHLHQDAWERGRKIDFGIRFR